MARWFSRSPVRVGAVLCGFALAATACSSSSTPTGGAGNAAVSPLAPSGSVKAPTGTPVTVGVIYTADNQSGNTPGIMQGATAAADYINADLGGIAGHPVQILACNGMNAPESDTTCATRFVSAHVVDVIGIDGLWGQDGYPITAKAGIVNQTTPLSAGEYDGPTSFPFDGGPAAGAGAVASYVLSKGWKSVACVYLDLASVKPGCDQDFATPLKAAGVKYVSVAIPPTATDFAQYAAAAIADKPQAILFQASPDTNARFVEAASQLGFKTQYFAANITASSDYFNIGSLAQGTIFYFPTRVWTDTSDPDVQTFVSAMKKYQPSAAINAESEQGFAGVMNVQRVGAGMTGEVTATDFVTAFKNLTNLKSFAGPVLNATDHLSGLANVYLTGAYLYQYEGNGNFSLLGSGLIKADQ